MRVGFCQFEPEFGEVEKNLKTVQALIGESQFDLMVLPELLTTGYQFQSKEETKQHAETLDGPTIKWALALAKRKQAFLCGGFVEADGEDVFNSAFLVGPDGLVGIYRKIHLFNREKECFAPGDGEFEVFDIGMAKVGIMICFDWIFPESMRELAIKGAQVVCHPANLVLPFCQESMKTRCLENGLFAITANRFGTEERVAKEKFTFSGQSQITAPLGKILHRASDDFTGVWITEIDPEKADNKKVNPFNDLLKDRRVEKYAVLSRREK